MVLYLLQNYHSNHCKKIMFKMLDKHMTVYFKPKLTEIFVWFWLGVIKFNVKAIY